jgi:iron complex outermembrane receptor protein
MLKYRFKHLAKADIEANYQHWSLGFSARYNSFMRNIDRVFEDDVDPSPISSIYILPGLKAYRELNSHGNLILDFRMAYTFKEQYRLSFIVNNFLNTEYATRPGDIQAPRNFIIQIQAKF